MHINVYNYSFVHYLARPLYSKKINVVVTRGLLFSCMLKCMEMLRAITHIQYGEVHVWPTELILGCHLSNDNIGNIDILNFMEASIVRTLSLELPQPTTRIRLVGLAYLCICTEQETQSST